MAQCWSMSWATDELLSKYFFLLHCFEVVVHWRLTLQWCQTLSPAQRGQWKQHRLKPMMLSLLPLLQMLSWWHLSKVGFKSFQVGILFLFCISLVPRLKKGREKDPGIYSPWETVLLHSTQTIQTRAIYMHLSLCKWSKWRRPILAWDSYQDCTQLLEDIGEYKITPSFTRKTVQTV